MAGAKSFGLPRISYPITTGSISFASSPALLGRYSAGAGPGEEIGLGVFSIDGGTLAAPATAQYELLGRASAGAGDMEITTRTAMNIPGLELANTFTATQTINGAFATNGDGVPSAFTQSRYQGTSPGANITQRKARGTLSAPSAVLLNDQAAFNNFNAYGTTTFQTAAQFNVTIIEPVPADGAMGASLRWFVAPLGSASLVENMRLDQAGGLQLYGANSVIDANRLLRRRVYTFATLPAAAGIAGAMAHISDGAAAPVWNAAAAGGGAVSTPVFSNNVAWNNG